jgi:hypothetical protein
MNPDTQVEIGFGIQCFMILLAVFFAVINLPIWPAIIPYSLCWLCGFGLSIVGLIRGG